MICELLAVQTDINDVEWVIVVKEWNVGEFTNDVFLFVVTLRTNPIRYLVFRIIFGVAFKPNRDAFTIVLNQ